MALDEGSESVTSRRTFLSASGTVGLVGLLAGCNAEAEQATSERRPNAEGDGDAFRRNGDEWVTFGAADDWGMRYNGTTNEFELVYNPLGANSRKNIRIEADENGDKGDVYIDDTIIVKNEAEVSDGSASDPSYTFSKQNNTGLWREAPGVLGVTTAGEPAMLFDNGMTRIAGDVTATDGRSTAIWDGEAKHAPNLPAASTRASGDGTKKTFLLTNPLDTAPNVATVTPASEDAAGEFWVSRKTEESVEVTYASPPPAGTGNLAFELVVSL
ncbi:hypothetical protein NDI76_16235 [Halogeometricum sp. S1BR25-6]|uniref:Uncharacterized protein n=1 Tax=Halogeometricum salsisoli TaxID=2950536 RepID=A0ABU2GHJ3_9EURY|nr:hypothetical protein [Halogeometricum sp. S1BR25-6]MDS0300296.1 hypothetical protein [Halogeometricum sp. S1BR25-6]